MVLGKLACVTHAHAGPYKWTDGQGKVHYSDQPPTVIAQPVIGTTTGQSETTNQTKQSLNAQDKAYQKRCQEAEEAQAKTEKEAEQARVQRENCTKARNNLSTLQYTPRVYTTNAAGQCVYMNEAARANALSSSQKVVSEHCK